MESKTLISIQNCRIENARGTVVERVDWCMKEGENWLVTGPNGGGKADFLNALTEETGLHFVPNTEPALYSNQFKDSTELVSLEKAARIIQEERENDESEYVEGGVDIGRTGRIFIAEKLWNGIKKNKALPEQAYKMEECPEIELTGIKGILDRGLKYMSTGEIRRTLLARALMSGKKLLILSDPFAGLDALSRKIIFDYVNQTADGSPAIILGMERWKEIPDTITHVLEFADGKICFKGKRFEYEKLIQERAVEAEKRLATEKEAFRTLFELTKKETAVTQDEQENDDVPEDQPLVQMTNVNVGWSDNHVLRNLNWTVNKGEHWLIRGPNGSGKTTLLELITGDNMQVYCNDVRLFGIKRGSGETIWDIKKHLGIVSYRLHVEYRMLGNTTLEQVIISGFRDSIGLYEAAKDTELSLAKKWLSLGGFDGREKESFGSLSYGEQRAILILRSVVKCPALLILDEPCHGLDENNRSKILHLMELIGTGDTTTMLHVTHDPSELLPCEHNILELMPDQEPMYKTQNI